MIKMMQHTFNNEKANKNSFELCLLSSRALCSIFFFQERYRVQLNEVGIEGPSRVEFKLADLDGDGILLLNEWRNWVAP